MMANFGGVWAVNTRVPIEGLPENGKLTLMCAFPCMYDKEGSPHDSSDYLSIVYCKQTHYGPSEMMDLLACYGPTCARWLSDFWQVV